MKILVPLEEMQNKPVRSFAELDKIISEPIGALKSVMKKIDSLRDEIVNNYRNSIIDECIEEIRNIPYSIDFANCNEPIIRKNMIVALKELKEV